MKNDLMLVVSWSWMTKLKVEIWYVKEIRFRNICLHREKTFVFVSHITQHSPALPSLRRKEIEIKIWDWVKLWSEARRGPGSCRDRARTIVSRVPDDEADDDTDDVDDNLTSCNLFRAIIPAHS